MTRLAPWISASLLCCACGPGDASEGSESDSSTDTGAPDPEDTEDTGAPDFPELPSEQPDCAAAGESHAIISGPHTIIEGTTHYLDAAGIEATSEGLLALISWRDPDDSAVEGIETPDLWAARLDIDGTPLGPVFPLLERQFEESRAHAVGDELVITFCGLWGVDGKASSMRIDQHGMILAPEVRRSPDRGCGDTPDGVWTGQRHLVAWRDNTSSAHGLLVDTFDQSGISTGWVQVQRTGLVHYPPPRFVLTSEAAFLLSATPNGHGLMLHRFDSLGTHLPDQTVELETPPDVLFNSAVIAANPDGIVVWTMTGYNDPFVPIRWRLDSEGQTLVGPVEVEFPSGGWYFPIEIVRRPGGFAISANWRHLAATSNRAAVLLLDPEGALVEIVALEDVPDASEARNPRLAQRGDSTFVLYEVDHESVEAGSDLRIVEIGCAD